tara:strand:+ start:275 stop:1450 length:1176 start_codon:yes stop_codon:yes gene_type:complete
MTPIQQMLLAVGGSNYYDAELFAWGKNDYGQLGQNNRTTYSSPRQISGTIWSAVGNNTAGSGNQTMIATQQDGTLWMWGRNQSGSLGQNEGSPSANYSSPVQVGSGTDWAIEANKCATNNSSAMAIKQDGTLWQWGSALGLNDQTKRSSPTQIPGTNWSAVAMLGAAAMAVKTDGTAWMMGSSEYGQLGLGHGDSSKSSPHQLPGTSWTSKISGGGSHFGAIRSDNTLWMWGNGYMGQIGQGNRSRYSSPKQVPGSWRSIGAGAAASYGIKTNNQMFHWGQNEDGPGGLAINTWNDNKSSPEQVPGSWGFTGGDYSSVTSDIVGVNYGGFAQKSDGTLWTWGRKRDGLRGLNSAQFPGYYDGLSSPVQIPGTNWHAVAVTEDAAIAIKIPS